MLNPIEKFKRSILHLNKSLHHCKDCSKPTEMMMYSGVSYSVQSREVLLDRNITDISKSYKSMSFSQHSSMAMTVRSWSIDSLDGGSTDAREIPPV